MSERFSGGFITKTPVTPTSTSASGIWTLDQQEQAQKAGNWPFGGPFNYIEDVFSTYLYNGNGSTNTIVNNINVSGKGGLVWMKSRSVSTPVAHCLVNTVQGRSKFQASNTTAGSYNSIAGYDLASFNNNGFTLGPGYSSTTNDPGDTYVSWTFRKQPKFFDVVTYTGDGVTNRAIPHSLGSVPGCVIIKRTDGATEWVVYHRSMSATPQDSYMFLSATTAKQDITGVWGTTAFSSTDFRVCDFGGWNASGGTYVAYVFAHNAGGFGLTGTDNVISCGSYTSSTSSQTINLGYEPQWLLIKDATSIGGWQIWDTMRGLSLTFDARLDPDSSNAETKYNTGFFSPTSTGFTDNGGWFGLNGDKIIYIAIRRGPMKVPTDGTKVFNTVTATGGPPTFTPGFVTDMAWTRIKNSTALGFRWVSRLLSGTYADSSSTAAEAALAQYSFDYQNGWRNATVTDSTLLSWAFQRAPSFFDEVCYTGTGATANISHNLGVAPELIIVKDRTNAFAWNVYVASLGPTARLELNTNATPGSGLPWNNTAPTNSVFTLSFFSNVNQAGDNYVAYLFASCPGVSKVGSYTGTGATQTISCGFTGGARFVLIKRTDAVGDWYVWDTARGMVSGTDPSLLLNSTAAEVNANSIYTTATGFQLLASPAADVNTNGGSYIYLAIA